MTSPDSPVEPPSSGPSSREPTRPGRAALAVVYVTVFVDLLGFGIILPSLPYYAETLGATGLGLGILLTSYSLAQLVGAAVLGRVSDRVGRRPILLASLAGSSVAMVLSGLAETLVLLCLARGLAGLFGGSISTAQAYVADVTRKEERAKYMGLVGASVGAGFVFGPALGAGIIALGGRFREAAFVAAALAALNLVFAWFRLPEPARRRVPRTRLTARQWLATLGRANLWQVFAGSFLVVYAFVSMETAFAFFGAARWGMDAVGFGKILATVGVVVVIVQGGLVGWISKALGVRGTAITGSALMGLGLALVPAAPSLAWATAALAVLAVGQGLAFPTYATLASHLAEEDEQGSVLGLRQSMAAGARAVGPVIAGALYDSMISSPFLVGGGVALLAAVLLASVTTSR